MNSKSGMKNINTNRKHLLLVALFLVVFLAPGSLYSTSMRESPHGDKRKLPQGCASCHKGHGQYNTPMLPESEDVFCFECHGHYKNVEQTRRQGRLSRDTKAADLQREFEKAYHHPIERTGIHKYGETLPETDPSKPRHSECADCHNHHYPTETNTLAGVKGITMSGAQVQAVTQEYELCFKCHLTSANLPADQIGQMEVFDLTNRSFHPVVGPGKNSAVPSLMSPLTATSTIKCTDCHNNDDPRGPKGPHGSNYRYLLAKNYTETDGSEGSFQYELCYGCHRRSSILGNESFQYHSVHVSFAGTSCKTCHDSHGSAHNAHLINFDQLSVMPSSSGRTEYIDLGRRAGQCYLTCHGKDHNPGVYPAAQSNSSQKQTPAAAPDLPAGFRNFQRFR